MGRDHKLDFFHFELERIASPKDVDESPHEYLQDLRKMLLHMEYEYPKGTRHHIFWIGIPQDSEMRIGIERNETGERFFAPMSEFIQAVIDKYTEFSWIGIQRADHSKSFNYDPEEAEYQSDMQSLRDACGPDGYLGDGVYLWGPHKNFP